MENNCCNMHQINNFFPSKHKPLRSKNVLLDMHDLMQQLKRTHEMSVSIFFLGGYPTWTTKHWCSCSKYYIKFIKIKQKPAVVLKRLIIFFPSKQKSLSKNICFDMQGTRHPTSCNSWKDPWNVSFNHLFWGYPTWATKQWCSCTKYYIKLK